MARGKKKESLTPEERLQAALVPESEQPYKVPENWCWVRLTSLKNGDNGFFDGDWILSENMDPTGDIRLLQLSDIGIGEFLDKSNKHINEKTFKQLACSELNEGDIMISRMAEPIARSCIVPKFPYKVITAVDVAVLRCNSHFVIDQYINYICNTKWFTDLAFKLARGTTRVRITRKNLGEMPIPLPPLTEQQRIVDRIESLFAKLDEAKQKAQEALDSFETRKAAILHKAFTGELTAQWRKEHGVGMKSWDRLQWGNFIVSIEAGKNWNAEGRPPRDDEFGVVKVSAVTWGEFNEAESKTCMVEEQWNENVQIHEGDFLFSRANTLQLVGNCVIVKFISRRLMLSDKILRLKFDKCVIPEYVLHFTRSDLYRNQIEQLASGNQDGMRNVSQKNMKLVEFPIPKLEEQKEIVRILNDLLTKEQQAKESAEGVLEQIDLIKKAILARAFRGELGTNDPTEENAVKLLCSWD